MGYFLERAGRNYCILEAGDRPGTFFRTKPRHRQLISINKVYTGYDDPEVNLRWDWNSLLSDRDDLAFREYSRDYFPSADTLVDYLGDYAAKLELRIETGVRVVEIHREDWTGHARRRFVLEDDAGRSWTAERLIVATGISKPYVPPIPGIELAENYVDAPVDPEDYANQRVLVLGKGNSGFEMAESLIATTALVHVLSPSSIRFAWRTHHVGHLRALNNNFLDTYQLKCQNAVLDASVESIRRLGDGRLAVQVAYSHAEGEVEQIVYDRVINCTGFRFDDSIFGPGCRPEMVIDDRFPAQTASWESTNVPDLFFAGTLMQVRDYKASASSFIHGFRYNIRTLHHLLERRYHGVDLPSRQAEGTVEGLTRLALARFNRSSALWQQFGYLADVVVMDERGPVATARHFEELPVDWLHESELGRQPHLYTLSLEFGPTQHDPFAVERKPNPEDAAASAFLHPVVRHYRSGELVDTVHVLENLFGEWHEDEHHRQPLAEFFARHLESERAVA